MVNTIGRDCVVLGLSLGLITGGQDVSFVASLILCVAVFVIYYLVGAILDKVSSDD